LGKKKEYAMELPPLLEAFPRTGSLEEIETYLAERSNLPGPRANLELAEAFAETIGRMGNGRPAQAWDLCSRLAGLALERAGQNNPGEFAAFCGVRGEGALGTVSDKFLERAMEALKEHSVDDRWRIRESVAASIQMLLVKSRDKVLR